MKRGNLTILIFVVFAAYIGYQIYEDQKLLAIQPSRQSLIAAEVDRRLDEYQSNVFKNCNIEVMEAAKEIADSIIFIKANSLMLIDSLGRPPKPDKPFTPKAIPLKDSSEVKPLVDSDRKVIQKDTLF